MAEFRSDNAWYKLRFPNRDAARRGVSPIRRGERRYAAPANQVNDLRREFLTGVADAVFAGTGVP